MLPTGGISVDASGRAVLVGWVTINKPKQLPCLGSPILFFAGVIECYGIASPKKPSTP